MVQNLIPGTGFVVCLSAPRQIEFEHDIALAVPGKLQQHGFAGQHTLSHLMEVESSRIIKQITTPILRKMPFHRRIAVKLHAQAERTISVVVFATPKIQAVEPER